MSEDIIWQILDEQFCSFKAKFDRKAFCKNEYNLTGMCNKMYCPLANGRYATIREEDGKLYLHVKTIERAHTPAKLWEKIELPEDIGGALSIINENLAFWPKRFVNKVKERLVRLHQYLIRYRKWYYKAKPRLVTVHKKFEKREAKRELKALVAAKLDTQILEELQTRWDEGVYEFINIHNKPYMEMLKEHSRREVLASGKKHLWKKMMDKEKAKASEENGEPAATFSNSTFVADEDENQTEDVEDLQEFEDGEEEEDLELEGEFEDEDEQEEEVEQEFEEEADTELRKDILKHIGNSFDGEDFGDSEIKRLKKQFISIRKRKLEQKQAQERKRTKEAQGKRKHYGAHVEIEYEPSTETNTTSSRDW